MGYCCEKVFLGIAAHEEATSRTRRDHRCSAGLQAKTQDESSEATEEKEEDRACKMMDLSKLSDDEILELIRETSSRTDSNGVCDLGNGYKAVPCPECRGFGFQYVAEPWPSHSRKATCDHCYGRGYFIVGPDGRVNSWE